MAVLVLGFIYDFQFDGTNLTLHVDIAASSDNRHNNVPFLFGPVSPDTTDAQINAAVDAFIRDYAVAEMRVIFGPEDTIRRAPR